MESPLLRIEGISYLDEDAIKAIHTLTGVDGEIARKVAEIARYSDKFITGLRVSTRMDTPEQRQRILCFVLLLRLLELVECILVMASVGARQEMKILLRVFLDAYFLLGNACSDAAFVATYVRTDIRDQLKWLNVAARHEHEVFQPLRKFGTAEVRAKLAERIEREQMPKLTAEQIAIKAGCGLIYDVLYRLTSSSVHTTPRCFLEYLRVDDNNNIVAVRRGGDGGDIDHSVFDPGYFLIKAMQETCKIFGQSDSELVRLAAELDVVGKKSAPEALTILRSE